MSLFYHRRPSFEIFTDFFSYSRKIIGKNELEEDARQFGLSNNSFGTSS